MTNAISTTPNTTIINTTAEEIYINLGDNFNWIEFYDNL